MDGDRLSAGVDPLISNLTLDSCELSDCLHGQISCQINSCSWRLSGTAAGLDILEK